MAVDALGGDHAPSVVVQGAVDAARAGQPVVLVGPSEALAVEVVRAGGTSLRDDGWVRIVDAPDGVAMDEPPLAAIRRKPRASIRVACELVAAGEAAGVFSAGHTGASLFAAHAAFGMLPGVDRPALTVTLPTRSGAAVLLDAGANVDCRPSHLVQFAAMGAAFASVALAIEEPRVGLLSIGEEATKGNDLVKDAHRLLAASSTRFVGNIDAAQFFRGDADVVVCDGFTGNIALKVGEGVVELIAGLLGPLGRGLSEAAARRLQYAEAGGAPLVGVNGLLVVGHGRSTAQAITSGIARTAALAHGDVVRKVAEAVGRVLK